MSPDASVADSGEGPADVVMDVWFGNASAAIDVSLLAPDERERVGRIASPVAARTYSSARTLLRQLLGARLGLAPEEICFRYGAQGKPKLCPTQNRTGVQFNLSHSGSMFAIALTRGSDVGVDIELARVERNFEQLAGAMLGPAERAIWDSLPTDIKGDWFYWAWTRKEAVLKLTGEGLSRDPRGVDIIGDGSRAAWILASRQIGSLTVAFATSRPAKLNVQVAWSAAESDAA